MKKKPVKKPAKRLTEKDWTKIRSEYASGSLSYRKLAEKHAQSFNTLKDRATKERWTDDRKKYRETLAKKTQQNLAQAGARACARDMKNLGEAAGNVSEAIKALLKDSKQLNRYIITEGLGGGETSTKERVFEKVDTRAMRDIAATMKDLTQVLRNVYGVPSLTDQSAMDIAAARLLMDQEKAKQDSGISKIDVHIIDPPEQKANEPKETDEHAGE